MEVGLGFLGALGRGSGRHLAAPLLMVVVVMMVLLDVSLPVPLLLLRLHNLAQMSVVEICLATLLRALYSQRVSVRHEAPKSDASVTYGSP